MKTKLTAQSVKALALPAGKADVIYFDTEISGFGLRFRRGAQGVIITWVLQHKAGRETLGRYPVISPAAAREWAVKKYAEIALGASPAAEREKARQQQAETFEAALRLYLPGKKLRPRSRVEAERHLLKNAAALHRLPLAKTGKREIAGVLTAVTQNSGEVQANRTRGSLSAFFMWCCRRGLLETNPVAFTEVHKETSRSRVLGDAELVQIWSHLPAGDYSDAVKLLILTAQRKSEIGDLQWREIDFARGVISLPAERVKNGRPHEIPITDPMRAILEARPRFGDYVFGRTGFRNWTDCKERLDVKLGIAAWHHHDIRRTAATRMIELGVEPHHVEAVLNHVGGHRSGVAGVYNRSLYAAEKAQALNRWATHVMALVSDEAPKVVPIRPAV
jgi:integrase